MVGDDSVTVADQVTVTPPEATCAATPAGATVTTEVDAATLLATTQRLVSVEVPADSTVNVTVTCTHHGASKTVSADFTANAAPDPDSCDDPLGTLGGTTVQRTGMLSDTIGCRSLRRYQTRGSPNHYAQRHTFHMAAAGWVTISLDSTGLSDNSIKAITVITPSDGIDARVTADAGNATLTVTPSKVGTYDVYVAHTNGGTTTSLHTRVVSTCPDGQTATSAGTCIPIPARLFTGCALIALHGGNYWGRREHDGKYRQYGASADADCDSLTHSDKAVYYSFSLPKRLPVEFELRDPINLATLRAGGAPSVTVWRVTSSHPVTGKALQRIATAAPTARHACRPSVCATAAAPSTTRRAGTPSRWPTLPRCASTSPRRIPRRLIHRRRGQVRAPSRPSRRPTSPLAAKQGPRRLRARRGAAHRNARLPPRRPHTRPARLTPVDDRPSDT